MAEKFTWERGPFEQCPQCQRETLGILSAGSTRLTMRCTECRYSHSEVLPILDKKVFYLDQSIFSTLYKVASGGGLPLGHEDFSKELYERLRELVLLQQIVLPHSSLHRDETIVFHNAAGLREAYEYLGGDISFTDYRDVEISQIYEHCLAYIEKREPKHNFEVDEVLDDERNHWLPDLHIGVTSDYSMFADDLRRSRDRTDTGMQKLFALWGKVKPSFDAALNHELKSFVPSPQQNEMLRELFEKTGLAAEQQRKAVNDFWQWEGNCDLPHHRLIAYLFAAFARRAALGQKKITRGLMNDVVSIATYAPYVDVMFLDQECADLLAEQPLAKDLTYKARIFSFKNGGEFLKYLEEIRAKTPAEVREFASRIYGV